MGKVTRGEWRWVWIFTALVVLLSLLPYLLASSAQGTAWRFSGFLMAVEDGNSYIAKMRLGSDGAWLYRLAYTTEPQTGALVFLPYLLLGKLAARPALHEQLVALFHLARLAAATALIVATYRFLARFVESITLRRWGLVLAVLGGGLGWLALAIGGGRGPMPLEYYSPESFGFLSLFMLPHLAAARALLLLALLWYLEGASGADRHGGWKAGLALVGLWFFQPLNVLVAWFVIALAFVLSRVRTYAGRRLTRDPALDAAARSESRRETNREGRTLALTAILPAPLIVYAAYAFSTNPALRQWTAQNVIASPAVIEYAAGYALIVPFVVAGLVAAWRAHERGANMLMGWVIAMPVLISLPVNLQRRLAEGVWVAAVALAMMGLAAWLERTRKRTPRLAALVLTALALPSTVLLFISSTRAAVRPAPPLFIPAAEAGAFEWLDGHAAPGSIVLTNFAAGNALPAYAHVTPYIGHGPETLFIASKRPEVQRFFSAEASGVERVALLGSSRANYVILDPADALGKNPTAVLALPGMRVRYEEQGWRVLEYLPVPSS